MAPTVKAVASDKSTSPPVLKFNGVLIVIGNGYNNFATALTVGAIYVFFQSEVNDIIHHWGYLFTQY
jgi:hypothetical protein